MKILSLALTVLFAFALNNSHAHESNQIDSDVVITIDGMTCEACTQTMTDVFSKEDSVKGVKSDLKIQTITVDVKDDQSLSDDAIKKHINWGGYDLISIERF